MASRLHRLHAKPMFEKRSLPRIPPNPDQRRADHFAIGHDAFQFKFDFWQSASPQDERAVTRIMTTPAVAIDFADALRESLRDYGRRMGRALPDPTSDEES